MARGSRSKPSRVSGRAPLSREGWRLGLLLALVLMASMTACSTRQATSDRAAPSGGISPLLSANFALLDAPPDGIPLSIGRALDKSVPEISWKLARRIPVSLIGNYWLVPGARKICVVAAAPGSASVGAVCASVTQALHHGVASTSLDPASGRRVIVGAVPTQIRSVIVRSGTVTTSASAFHGHFVLCDTVAVPPDELTLRRGPGGEGGGASVGSIGCGATDNEGERQEFVHRHSR